LVAMNCLHHLIEAQSRRTPEAAALAFESQRMTYRELDRRANRLAAYLRRLGAGPEARVGLFVERSMELMVGILAVLKAGAAYVPIDTAYPRERLAFMLGDAGVKLVLSQAGLEAKLPASDARTVRMDEFDWQGDADAPGDVGVRPEHLAYVIYTSGSTGVPKGVCIEHRNIVHYVLGVAQRLQLEAGMTHATVSTIAADLGNTVIFPALVTGGCLHLIAQERTESQALLAEYFRRERVDVLKIVPSHLAALQSVSRPEEVMPARRLVLGGEASRLDWIERLRAAAPQCAIYNHYGPTETTVGVLTYRLESQLPPTQSRTLPLGRPLPDTSIYLLDGQGQPVPAGEKGEICIGGHGVARGYLNRPELTAEKFVPDPFSADPGARMYRTGDLGRSLPGGDIEFCGRGDHQVKLNGYRVELGEIEAALREQGEVQEAVVLVREDAAGEKQLVGYVASKPAAPFMEGLNAALLREHLKARLPHYMVPSAFVLMENLPLTANGKIDRQALAAMSVDSPARGADYVAPRTATEQTLASIWSELLKVDEVGIHDDVFDLGAHSLLAMKALTQIREAFRVNLVLRNLFEQPSVAQLAPVIDGLASLTHAAPASPDRGGREEIVL
jgi:amino acid adenylation domain-containing protein